MGSYERGYNEGWDGVWKEARDAIKAAREEERNALSNALKEFQMCGLQAWSAARYIQTERRKEWSTPAPWNNWPRRLGRGRGV